MKLGVICDGISRDLRHTVDVMDEFGLDHAELQFVGDKEVGDHTKAEIAAFDAENERLKQAILDSMDQGDLERALAQRLGHADDRPGQHAGHRERHDVMKRRLHPGRAHAQRRLADRGRHGLQRRAAGDDNCRQRHQGKH